MSEMAILQQLRGCPCRLRRSLVRSVLSGAPGDYGRHLGRVRFGSPFAGGVERWCRP